jgi:hypothetical protein
MSIATFNHPEVFARNAIVNEDEPLASVRRVAEHSFELVDEGFRPFELISCVESTIGSADLCGLHALAVEQSKGRFRSTPGLLSNTFPIPDPRFASTARRSGRTRNVRAFETRAGIVEKPPRLPPETSNVVSNL